MSELRFILNRPIPIDETRHCEFKEVKGVNAIAAIKNAVDEYVVAFLNAEGGRIYWGIRDADKTVVGVRLDPGERDELRRKVTDQLVKIQPPIAPTEYRIGLNPIFSSDDRPVPIPDLFVVEVVVPRGSALLYFTGGNEPFVKTDAGKKKLSGLELMDEVVRRAAKAPRGHGTQIVDHVAVVFLVDQAVRFCLEIPGNHLTHGESWRLIELVDVLLKQVEARLPTLTGKVGNEPIRRIQAFVESTLRWYLGEAKLAVPKPGSDAEPGFRSEHFGESHRGLSAWDSIRSEIGVSAGVQADLATLQGSPVRWTLMGFSSQKHFREWLFPIAKSIGVSTGPLEIALLKRLVGGGNSVLVLEEEGFPRTVIVETVNRLLRDKWAEFDGEVIRPVEEGSSRANRLPRGCQGEDRVQRLKGHPPRTEPGSVPLPRNPGGTLSLWTLFVKCSVLRATLALGRPCLRRSRGVAPGAGHPRGQPARSAQACFRSSSRPI